MEPHAACKLPPPAVLFAAQCTLLAGSELPSVSALASLPLWTPSPFFFFTSWAQLAYFILYIQFKCHEFKRQSDSSAVVWARECSTGAGAPLKSNGLFHLWWADIRQSIVKYWFDASLLPLVILNGSCFIDDLISYFYGPVSLKPSCATAVICDPFYSCSYIEV